MTPKLARVCIVVMFILAAAIAVISIFFDQDYIGAIIGISASATFYYVYRNPKIMMARNWEEFCKLYDDSRDKKYVWGFPAYHAVMLAAILYIWLV